MALNDLLKLDDDTLKDIGLSRSDLLWAGSLPLSKNAVAELQIRAKSAKNK